MMVGRAGCGGLERWITHAPSTACELPLRAGSPRPRWGLAELAGWSWGSGTWPANNPTRMRRRCAAKGERWGRQACAGTAWTAWRVHAHRVCRRGRVEGRGDALLLVPVGRCGVRSAPGFGRRRAREWDAAGEGIRGWEAALHNDARQRSCFESGAFDLLDVNGVLLSKNLQVALVSKPSFGFYNVVSYGVGRYQHRNTT